MTDALCPGARDAVVTRYVVKHHTLVIDLETPRRVLSSAPRRGGFVVARSIINHQVANNPLRDTVDPGGLRRRWRDPARYLGMVAESVSAPRPCVGLMTAVLMRRLIVLREQADQSGGLWVEGFFTVGVTNAVRAGEAVAGEDATPRPGTINMILLTNAALTASAMVTVVQVATESKTAVLLAQGVKSWTGQPGATGTGTDAVVVASGDGPRTTYGGTHTEIGGAVGRLVERGVRQGLQMCLHTGEYVE
jgi:adenosylcobinamide amidohydrolase